METTREEELVCSNCEESTSTIVNHNLCYDCYYEQYCECESCSNEVLLGDILTSSNGGYYCSDCYYDHYTTCFDCECEVHRDETYWYDDEPYCDGCEPCGLSICVDRIENAEPPSRSRVAETFDYLNVKRLVGIESECVYPVQDSMYYPKNWAHTYDGSISPPSEYEGIEMVSSPSSGDILQQQIRDLSDWAKEHAATVNSSCGLHIHFDSTDLTYRQVTHIAIVYKEFEPYLKSMMPPSRQDSRWCKEFPLSIDDLLRVDSEEDLIDIYYESMDSVPSADKYNDARYCGFNIHSRYFHGSLEFRLHSGTTNFTKIRNWIRILNAIIEKGIELESSKEHIDKFLGDNTEYKFKKVLGDELHSYFLKRQYKFL